MQHDDEERRRRAYAIWEREGRPEGRAADHWDRAQHDATAHAQEKGAGAGRRAPRRRGGADADDGANRSGGSDGVNG